MNKSDLCRKKWLRKNHRNPITEKVQCHHYCLQSQIQIEKKIFPRKCKSVGHILILIYEERHHATKYSSYWRPDFTEYAKNFFHHSDKRYPYYSPVFEHGVTYGEDSFCYFLRSSSEFIKLSESDEHIIFHDGHRLPDCNFWPQESLVYLICCPEKCCF